MDVQNIIIKLILMKSYVLNVKTLIINKIQLLVQKEKSRIVKLMMINQMNVLNVKVDFGNW